MAARRSTQWPRALASGRAWPWLRQGALIGGQFVPNCPYSSAMSVRWDGTLPSETAGEPARTEPKAVPEHPAQSIDYERLLQDPVDGARDTVRRHRLAVTVGEVLLRDALHEMRPRPDLRKLADDDVCKGGLIDDATGQYARLTKREYVRRAQRLHSRLARMLQFPHERTLLDVCVALREEKVTPRRRTFNMLLCRLTRFGHHRLAKTVVFCMDKWAKVPHDDYTRTAVIKLCGLLGDYSRLDRYIARMREDLARERGVRAQFSLPIYCAVIHALSRLGRLDQAEMYYEACRREHAEPNLKLLTQILSVYALQRNWDKGAAIMNTLVEMRGRDPASKEEGLDNWAIYHMIIFCEQCGRYEVADAIRTTTGTNPLFNHFTTRRPTKVQSTVFLPWDQDEPTYTEEPMQPRFQRAYREFTRDHVFNVLNSPRHLEPPPAPAESEETLGNRVIELARRAWHRRVD